MEIIKRDIDGRAIRKGQKFKFKFLKSLNKPIELIGSFDYNSDELRYEIDIHNHDEYACLSYVNGGVMYDSSYCPDLTNLKNTQKVENSSKIDWQNVMIIAKLNKEDVFCFKHHRQGVIKGRKFKYLERVDKICKYREINSDKILETIWTRDIIKL